MSNGDPETTDTQALIWHVEYGLTERIAVHASLPFMIGAIPGGDLTRSVAICSRPISTTARTTVAFQDFYFGVRYGLVQSPGSPSRRSSKSSSRATATRPSRSRPSGAT